MPRLKRAKHEKLVKLILHYWEQDPHGLKPLSGSYPEDEWNAAMTEAAKKRGFHGPYKSGETGKQREEVVHTAQAG